MMTTDSKSWSVDHGLCFIQRCVNVSSMCITHSIGQASLASSTFGLWFSIYFFVLIFNFNTTRFQSKICLIQLFSSVSTAINTHHLSLLRAFSLSMQSPIIPINFYCFYFHRQNKTRIENNFIQHEIKFS